MINARVDVRVVDSPWGIILGMRTETADGGRESVTVAAIETQPQERRGGLALHQHSKRPQQPQSMNSTCTQVCISTTAELSCTQAASCISTRNAGEVYKAAVRSSTHVYARPERE